MKSLAELERPSRIVRIGFALGVAALPAAGSWGQAAEHPLLLALSKTDQTLAIVDPVTLKVMAKPSWCAPQDERQGIRLIDDHLALPVAARELRPFRLISCRIAVRLDTAFPRWLL
jgi:hypothetical protein